MQTLIGHMTKGDETCSHNCGFRNKYGIAFLKQARDMAFWPIDHISIDRATEQLAQMPDPATDGGCVECVVNYVAATCRYELDCDLEQLKDSLGLCIRCIESFSSSKVCQHHDGH